MKSENFKKLIIEDSKKIETENKILKERLEKVKLISDNIEKFKNKKFYKNFKIENSSSFFTIEDGIVYFNEFKTQKDKNTIVEKTTVCEALFISRVIENESTKECIAQVEVISYTGAYLTHHIPFSSFSNYMSNDNVYFKKIRESVTINNSKLFASFIKCLQNEAKQYVLTGSKKSGWVEDEYINNNFSTQNAESKGIVYMNLNRNSHAPEFVSVGSEETQIELYKNLSDESPIFFFTTAFYLTGFISSFVKIEYNPILTLLGDSSEGKSTLLKFCQGMYTLPDKMGNFSSTQNSINEILLSHKDCSYVIDEIGMSKSKQEEKIAWFYQIANQVSKTRMNREGEITGNKEKTYYTLLMSGEVSFFNDATIPSGLKMRNNELVINKQNPIFSIFNDIERSRYVEEITTNLEENFGHIVPRFIDIVYENQDKIKKIYTDTLEIIRKKYKLTNNIALRKAKVFALTFVAAYYYLDVLYDNNMSKENKEELIYSNIDFVFDKLVSDVSIADTSYRGKAFKIIEDAEEIFKEYFEIIKLNEYNIDVSTQSVEPKRIIGTIKVDTKETLIRIKANEECLAQFFKLCNCDAQLLKKELINLGFMSSSSTPIKDKKTKKSIRYYTIKCSHIQLNEYIEEQERFKQEQEIANEIIESNTTIEESNVNNYFDFKSLGESNS